MVEGIEGQTQTFRSLHPKVCEVPFSSISKLQLTIHEARDFQTNGYLLTMFGEPETVLNRCASALVQGLYGETYFLHLHDLYKLLSVSHEFFEVLHEFFEVNFLQILGYINFLGRNKVVW